MILWLLTSGFDYETNHVLGVYSEHDRAVREAVDHIESEITYQGEGRPSRPMLPRTDVAGNVEWREGSRFVHIRPIEVDKAWEYQP